MKDTIVVLVLGALLLHHHDASVDAFRQSSRGRLNRHLKKLTYTFSKFMPIYTFSKPMPMHGYLDSLGNTASTFKVKLASNTELEKIPPLSEEKLNSAETKPVINDVYKNMMLTLQARENMKAEVNFVTAMPQSEGAVKSQEKTPKAMGVEKDSADNEMTRSHFFAKSAPDQNIPEINGHKVGTNAAVPSANPGPESASRPFGAYLGSLAEMSPEDDVPATAEMAGAPTTTIDTQDPLWSAKSRGVSTKFGGYLGMLSNKATSEVDGPAKAKMQEAHTADTPNLQTADRAMPAVAEMAEAPTPTTADTPKTFSSAKPKPKSVSTPFGGYIGSLTKADDRAVPAAAEIAEAPISATVDIRKAVSSAKPKPQSSSTIFGGYIGSLKKPFFEAVAPTTTNMPEAHADVDTPKMQTDDLDVSAASERVEGPITKPRSVSTSFGGYLSSLTKGSSKDRVLTTANLQESAVVGDAPKLQTDNLNVPAAAEMAKGPTTPIVETVSSANMPESADAPKLQTDNHGVPAAAQGDDVESSALHVDGDDDLTKGGMDNSAMMAMMRAQVEALTKEKAELRTIKEALEKENARLNLAGSVKNLAESKLESLTPTAGSVKNLVENELETLMRAQVEALTKEKAELRAIQEALEKDNARLNLAGSVKDLVENKLETPTPTSGSVKDLVENKLETPTPITGDTSKPVSSANMPESPAAADAPKLQPDNLAAAKTIQAPATPTVDPVSLANIAESPAAINAPKLETDTIAVPAAAEMEEVSTTPTADTPEPFWSTKPTPKASSEFVVPAADKMSESPTAMDTLKVRIDDYAVPALAKMTEIFTSAKEFASTSTALKTDIATEMAAWPLEEEEAAPVETAAFVEEIEAGTAKIDWETASPIILQGGALRTWSDTTGSAERVQLSLRTEGRPLNAHVELWHGPGNTPLKMSIFSDDGDFRPFNAVIETPGSQNTIAIRNTGTMEFPLAACVGTDVEDVAKTLSDKGTLKKIQGGSINTYPFDRTVTSVQILLMTGGRPLNARIELSQGPNSSKQYIDIQSENGKLRPFFAVIETPGAGSVIRVVNTGTQEFPVTASVEPYENLAEPDSDDSSARGWDNNGGGSSFHLGGR